MKKVFFSLSAVAMIFLTACGSSAISNQAAVEPASTISSTVSSPEVTLPVTPEPTSTPIPVADILGFDCEDVVEKLKAGRNSISDYVIFTSENDPNGPDIKDYIQKAIFLDDLASDDVNTDDYAKGFYASGTIELFTSREEAEKRATSLQEAGVDSYSIRIVADNILLRLNNEYTDRDADMFASILDGEIHSIDDDVIIVNPIEYVPFVSYDQIKEGGYAKQPVCVQAIISDVSVHIDYHGQFKYAFFDLWYEHEDTYICDQQCHIYDDRFEQYPYLSSIADVTDGDVIKMVVTPMGDNSFGATSCTAIEIVDHIDMSDIYTDVINKTPLLPYEEVERNPDNYKNSLAVVKGTIFQIIEEGSTSCEYLVKTSNGIVYITWYSNESARGSRFLENDRVTVYGKCAGLKTYSTLTGDKKVPLLQAAVIIPG